MTFVNSPKQIRIRGAKVHNLKNVDVDIPRDALVTVTGLSGSGKSSLAFDTLYAEGHRRFVESLSSYARMFIGQMSKPDVDFIEGLSPAISIDQKTTSHNPRSTVGTVTEIYDYLRLMYARVGIPHCPICGKEIKRQSVDQILERIMALPQGTRFNVLSPVVRDKKGTHEKLFQDMKKAGFPRFRVDGNIYDIGEEIELDKNIRHHIEIVVDRLILKDSIRPRLSDAVETALKYADGHVMISTYNPDGTDGEEYSFSQVYACEEHGYSAGELEPRMFSFNNPQGACPTCSGIGSFEAPSPQKMIPDRSKSLRQGAIQVNGFKTMDEDSWNGPLIAAVCERIGTTIDTPISEMTDTQLDAILYGTGPEKYEVTRYFSHQAKHGIVTYDGIVKTIQMRMKMGLSPDYYRQFFDQTPCRDCKGKRLNPGILAVTVGGVNIIEFCEMSIGRALEFINQISFTEYEQVIVKDVIKEIRNRLQFLINVGLDYLTLFRTAETLSGGEAQRIRLATQIGSALTGVMYILDEPSIGLHQRDNYKLINTLKRLRDLGNTVIVVEHDEETMRESDYLIDVGPGPGIHGGRIVCAGTPEEVAACEQSVTGDFLSGRKKIEVPEKRRQGNGKILSVRGARTHNLKNIDVDFPLGCFICVTGVSGSGKSSLVNGVLTPVLAHELNGAVTYYGDFDRIEGLENLDKVISIDQSPIGRTSRSDPATYTGVFSDIRDLFSKTPDAKMRGYTPGRFSFNIKGGRCEACEGDGIKRIEMNFLPDVYVECDVCHGLRYNKDTLECRYKGKNIGEVLNTTVEEGLALFDGIPAIKNKLQTLYDVGLGYIQIGQNSTTLSGGEAQRVKLAKELSRKSTGKTIYILDEPTTGLHSQDVQRLLDILHLLVERGNTVLVIEHNLDVIKTADYIVDLGPEGGEGGGTVLVTGTPEEVARCEKSYTGQFLKPLLGID
ncbi:MAG: excinuclease ABC subunit UvrA [Clostridia bacterium]|nr:excinuclease ABC subunit UvrA [Clostridia bacterium]